MTEQDREQVEDFLRKSLQREVDRRILTDIAIQNDIDVENVLREYNQGVAALSMTNKEIKKEEL